MQHHSSLLNASLQNCWLTIGVFDGVHLGHQSILKQLTAGAHTNGAPAVLLSFHPHPAVVLAKRDVKLLTTPDERADLVSALGIDALITHPFDAPTAGTSAQAFMSLLKKHLGLSHLLIGYDFALGKNREGDAARLTELGRELGYEVELIRAVADEASAISSTAIRKLISAGNVEQAATLLGRAYRLSGPIVHGAGRGRQLGIPTANIDYPEIKLIPARGIYACRAHLGAENFMAAVSIGVNPTFTPEKQIASVEAHLLDFDRDIYGQTLSLDFIARLRDEMKFDSVEALLAQIKKDIEQARKILA